MNARSLPDYAVLEARLEAQIMRIFQASAMLGLAGTAAHYATSDTDSSLPGVIACDIHSVILHVRKLLDDVAGDKLDTATLFDPALTQEEIEAARDDEAGGAA